MVHGESVIFEEPSSQGHFVGGLNYGCTEIPQTLILILVHHIEGRGQKLLSELLGRRKMGATCF
jgi:hypothetical protein|tara:strand:+ start:626 stop:817 length:192 start_codon:yes stop_codon:yes gene_type:complete